MNWFDSLSVLQARLLLVVAAFALLGGCASKPPLVDTNVVINFPSDERVTGVEQADEILRYVKLSRSQIDWRYRQKEQICYDKFFMNVCLRDAREERRVDLARVKKSEVAANFFKRKNQVEEMDRNLVEKNVSSPLPDPSAVKKPEAIPDPDGYEADSDSDQKKN